MIRITGITTYPHRDYSNNGVPEIISKAEAKALIDKFNAKYKVGKISATERSLFTDATIDRVVPTS